MRLMNVCVYKSKSSESYWFLRVVNPVTEAQTDINITSGKASDLMMLGVPRVDDGGGL